MLRGSTAAAFLCWHICIVLTTTVAKHANRIKQAGRQERQCLSLWVLGEGHVVISLLQPQQYSIIIIIISILLMALWYWCVWSVVMSACHVFGCCLALSHDSCWACGERQWQGLEVRGSACRQAGCHQCRLVWMRVGVHTLSQLLQLRGRIGAAKDHGMTQLQLLQHQYCSLGLAMMLATCNCIIASPASRCQQGA